MHSLVCKNQLCAKAMKITWLSCTAVDLVLQNEKASYAFLSISLFSLELSVWISPWVLQWGVLGIPPWPLSHHKWGPLLQRSAQYWESTQCSIVNLPHVTWQMKMCSHRILHLWIQWVYVSTSSLLCWLSFQIHIPRKHKTWLWIKTCPFLA